MLKKYIREALGFRLEKWKIVALLMTIYDMVVISFSYIHSCHRYFTMAGIYFDILHSWHGRVNSVHPEKKRGISR